MKKNKKEFSKLLLIQESVLIWIVTIAFLGLAALCIIKDYTGSLPWLTAMVSLPWTAYGVSQGCYYAKAKKENTVGGIKYETVLEELKQNTNNDEFIFESPEFELDNKNNVDLDYGI